MQRLSAIALGAGSLLVLSGCGTFSGMSWDEQDQASKDLAKESNYWPALKPERSLQDNREIPAQTRSPGSSLPP